MCQQNHGTLTKTLCKIDESTNMHGNKIAKWIVKKIAGEDKADGN